MQTAFAKRDQAILVSTIWQLHLPWPSSSIQHKQCSCCLASQHDLKAAACHRQTTICRPVAARLGIKTTSMATVDFTWTLCVEAADKWLSESSHLCLLDRSNSRLTEATAMHVDQDSLMQCSSSSQTLMHSYSDRGQVLPREGRTRYQLGRRRQQCR